MNLHLYTVRQHFNRPQCVDIEGTVRREIAALDLSLRAGSRVAIAAGSRGIANIDLIVRASVAALREAGAHPFIVPAMGSHGGATAEGQLRVLAEAGITEEKVGAPVLSSMEVMELPAGDLGNRLFMDRFAAESDGVILINRIKPHTDFHGSYESGLAKIAVVGLGKHAAALEMHSFGVSGLRDRIPRSFQKIIETGKIFFGLAIVENAYDETATIEAIPAARIFEREPQLLESARAGMPKLPVDNIDVLIVDRIGKEVSGVGMDPNIIGRLGIRGEAEPAAPRIKAIMIADLSPHSYGNAIGIGLADVITRKLFNKIDFEAMYVNARTSLFLERAKVPFIAETAAAAFALALRSCGPLLPGAERIVRILDTLHLGEVQVSKAILDEIRSRVEVMGCATTIFDEREELV